MTLTIRQAAAADDDAIWAILKPAIESGEFFTADPAGGRAGGFDYWRGPGAVNFVAELEGRIVGTYYVKPNQNAKGNAGHVCNAGYCTSPEARGHGVAQAMLSHSLEEAKRRGFRAMQYNLVVATNEGAVRLWKSKGFDIVGTLPGAFDHPRLGFVDANVMYKVL